MNDKERFPRRYCPLHFAKRTPGSSWRSPNTTTATGTPPAPAPRGQGAPPRPPAAPARLEPSQTDDFAHTDTAPTALRQRQRGRTRVPRISSPPSRYMLALANPAACGALQGITPSPVLFHLQPTTTSTFTMREAVSLHMGQSGIQTGKPTPLRPRAIFLDRPGSLTLHPLAYR